MATKKQNLIPPNMSDEAVRAKTGKDWRAWFEILDAAQADKWNHKEIVAFLSEKHQVGPWWQQTVTVTYEKAWGMRAMHEMPEGFAVSVNRTFSAMPLLPKAQLHQELRKKI